jgi:hypothetical protein
MHTQAQLDAAAKRAAQFAASADPSRNDQPAERAAAELKLRAVCEKFGFDLYAYAPYLREPEPAAAEQPSKADNGRAARRTLCAEIVRSVQHVYSGPSPAFHTSGNQLPLDLYLSRDGKPGSPGHKAAKALDRDHSAMLAFIMRGDGVGGFDPVALCADLGVISRLCSLDYVEYVDGYRLTVAGLERAHNIANNKRA